MLNTYVYDVLGRGILRLQVGSQFRLEYEVQLLGHWYLPETH
jgi:hypothetical protein